jgi:hypothetical protein
MGQDKDNKLVDERQIIISQIMNEYLWQSTKQYEVKTFEFPVQRALILLKTGCLDQTPLLQVPM